MGPVVGIANTIGPGNPGEAKGELSYPQIDALKKKELVTAREGLGSET
jgi:hypothetical protein